MIKTAYKYLISPLLLGGYRLYSIRDRKAREFFAIREGMFERLAERRSALGNSGGSMVLFHVASVGELLQAMPVMAVLKERPSPPLVALSYTSSSVENNMPKGIRADVITPSPLDTPARAAKFLDILAPDLLVFSTYDVWPGLLLGAVARKTPVIMINASLPAGSGRLKFPARYFFRGLYRNLNVVGAIAADHAARFQALGLGGDAVRVTGNCRFDQTLERCRSVMENDPDLAPIPPRVPTVVAGSVWPEDNRQLLPALCCLISRHPDMGAVVAPHEPSEAHVAEIEEHFRGAGIGTARYSGLREGGLPSPAPVVVVDAVGVLYKLYRRGTMAYVGGSFRQGVHNVMEPAGMGIPVVVGPVHGNSAEAMDMIEVGGAAEAGSVGEIESVLERWIKDEGQRASAGEKALQVVESNAGATARTVALTESFLPAGGGLRREHR